MMFLKFLNISVFFIVFRLFWILNPTALLRFRNLKIVFFDPLWYTVRVPNQSRTHWSDKISALIGRRRGGSRADEVTFS